jgi:hypothetical protein
LVEPVCVRSRIGEGKDRARPPIIRCAHDTPFDLSRIEWLFELSEEFLALRSCEFR